LALDLEGQRRIRHAIVTHSHLDHIASLPIYISEIFTSLEEPVCIYSTREAITSLREHIFNGKIWPDFEKIRLLNGNGFGLRYIEIESTVPIQIGGLRITPVWTNHAPPTVGLAIEEDAAGVIFTSDTSHTEEIWGLANRMQNLQAVFVDVSYPNELEALASASKHLTPQGLAIEMRKLRPNVPVFAIHMKFQYRDAIIRQLQDLGRSNLFIGEVDQEYRFPMS